MPEMLTTHISALPTGSAGGSKYLVQDDGNNTTKVTVNDAVAAASAVSTINNKIGSTSMGTTATTVTGAVKEHSDKIGSTSMGTTATTITGAIAEHESDITALNGNSTGTISGVTYTSNGTVDIGRVSKYYTGIHVEFVARYNIDVPTSTAFATIPSGFRPSGNYGVPAVFVTSGGQTIIATVTIAANGNIMQNAASTARAIYVDGWIR